MTLLVSIFFLIIGFIALVKGADLLVDGAGSLAKRIGISELVIGLTIVAFGTSAPELVVNILSALRGSTELAVGNIVGSNIANILLILGIASIIYPLSVKKATVWKEIPLMLVAAIAMVFLANDYLIDGASASATTRIDGLILLLFFAIFLFYTYGVSRTTGGMDNPDIVRRSLPKASVMIVLGLGGLILGGYWIVESAVSVATTLGISQAVIGLTIVAVGTSLPELATSVMAAWRRNVDIAIGNVVGSNIFNVLFILSTTSIIRPLPLSKGANVDFAVMLAASIALFLTMFVGKRHKLERWQGTLFLVFYAVYIGFLVIRG